MTSVTIQIHKAKAGTPQPVVKRARKWGDPVLVELGGWTTANVGSNFQPIMLSAFDARGWANFGGVHIFQRVDEAFLLSLQYAQPDKEYGSLTQKMNWLINSNGSAGRPYWYTEKGLVFGAVLFGGQLVEIESEHGTPVDYWRRAKYQARA